MSMRKAKMGDLLLKYGDTTKAVTAASSRTEKVNSPHKNLIQAEQSYSRASPSPQRPAKRMRYVHFSQKPKLVLIIQ